MATVKLENTLLAILITSLLWIILSMILYIGSKKRIEKILTQANENQKASQTAFTQKLEEALNIKNTELRDSYNSGYADAKEKKELSVQIIPWKEEIDSSTFFKNKKSIKLGYKHQLFSNGMPCFEPHITVVEELTVDKLNEENINRALTNLELAMNHIPNTGSIAVKVLGSGKDIGKSLLELVKKK